MQKIVKEFINYIINVKERTTNIFFFKTTQKRPKVFVLFRLCLIIETGGPSYRYDVPLPLFFLQLLWIRVISQGQVCGSLNFIHYGLLNRYRNFPFDMCSTTSKTTLFHRGPYTTNWSLLSLRHRVINRYMYDLLWFLVLITNMLFVGFHLILPKFNLNHGIYYQFRILSFGGCIIVISFSYYILLQLFLLTMESAIGQGVNENSL